MASKLISMNAHSLVFRCEDELDGAVASVVSEAPEPVKRRLANAKRPWCLKLTRLTPRHLAYQRSLLDRICRLSASASASSLPPMPRVLGVWTTSADLGMKDDSRPVLATASNWAGGYSSLTDAVKSSTIEEKARIMAALASVISGFTSLRPEPLVHGDLKPANIVVRREGASFHAIAVDHDTLLSLRQPRDFSIPGTKGFSAPELSRHPSTAFLGRADVFSFGAIATKTVPELLSCSKGFARLAASCLRDDPFERPAPARLRGLAMEALAATASPKSHDPGAPVPGNPAKARSPSAKTSLSQCCATCATHFP